MRDFDPRSIDTQLGVLSGEASQQDARAIEPQTPVVRSLYHPATYYDRPVLKEPLWIWSVPLYFYVGGLSGAAMALALASQVVAGPRLREFEIRCRWVGAVGGGIGSALLIWDLGVRSRFLYMLRVFRPTSPMSVGSWVLAAATPCSAGSAMLGLARGPLRPVGHMLGFAAGLLGVPLATYTAVLIGNTAVPLWQETRRTLPFVFGSSAVASMVSIFEFMSLPRREEAIVRRYGLIGRVGELVAVHALEREAHRTERVGAPLREGFSGALWTAAKVCTIASLGVSLLPTRSKAKRWTSAILGTAGGICLRYAVYYAGKRSARDPRATFELQRGQSWQRLVEKS